MQISESHKWLFRTFWPVGVLCLFVLAVGITQLNGVETEPELVDGAGPDVTVPDDRTASEANDERERSDALVDEPEGHILGRLLMPVEGVEPGELYDSFHDARGEDREHEALDIMADRGTHVLAATSGTVAEIHESGGGGKSIYKLSPDSSYIFYYAHLDEYAEDLETGLVVQQGDTLGTVGSTGNAHQHSPHLHFAIWEVDDPEWIWQGEAINPYPLLSGE